MIAALALAVFASLRPLAETAADPRSDTPDAQVETLDYRAVIRIGRLRAGTFRARMRERRTPTGDGPVLVRSLYAEGSHPLYEVEAELSTRVEPGATPRRSYRDEQRGSDVHRNEIVLLPGRERWVARYRSDTDVPEGGRRWNPPLVRRVPAGTLDPVSALWRVREMVRAGERKIAVPLAEGGRVWLLTLERGELFDVTVPAGTFRAREVLLATDLLQARPGYVPPPGGEPATGPFGLDGSLSLYFDDESGVPLLIRIRLSLGPLDIIGDLEWTGPR